MDIILKQLPKKEMFVLNKSISHVNKERIFKVIN